MKNHNNLMKKTTIYAIGNFGSKILSYLMVLLYSYFINPTDLGYYDLIITTIAMLLPLISFEINDGVYRYLIGATRENQKKTISSSFYFLSFTILISEVILFAINYIYNIKYILLIAAYILSIAFFTFFQEVIRGLEKTKLYVGIGLINSLLILIIEAMCLCFFHLGVVSLIISKITSYTISIVLIIFSQDEIKQALKYKLDKELLLKILKYSIPIIPNAVCWWCLNSSDRFIIVHYLGVGFNGIYTIANKFPTVITTITGIFYLAWQETAIKEYNNCERDELFSSVFEKYYIILFSICLCAIPLTHIFLNTLLASNYKIAWEYTFFLYLGAIFSSFCSFLGVGYQISKDTKRSVTTTVLSVIINFLVNLLLIKKIGLQSASFSTFISFFFLFLIRLKHTKNYFVIKINWVKFVFLFIICILYTFVILMFKSFIVSAILLIFSIFILLIFNYKIIYNYLLVIIKK